MGGSDKVFTVFPFRIFTRKDGCRNTSPMLTGLYLTTLGIIFRTRYVIIIILNDEIHVGLSRMIRANVERTKKHSRIVNPWTISYGC